MTDGLMLDNRHVEFPSAPGAEDGPRLASAPVTVAAAVVVVAPIVGAFLLGRSSGSAETAPVTATSAPLSDLVPDPCRVRSNSTTPADATFADLAERPDVPASYLQACHENLALATRKD